MGYSRDNTDMLKLDYPTKWIATAIVLLATGVNAQPGSGARRTVAAGRITAPPVIDGVVDDECWQTASSTDSLIQFEPRHGEPSPHGTVIYVGFDDGMLYVAFVCDDPDPQDESTIIHRVRSSYYFIPDLFCKLFFQSNSAINKENAQASLVWRFLPPFGSLQLVYQRGTSVAGTESGQGHTLFTKLSWVF